MTEPIDQATKERIEKEAIEYAQKIGDKTKDFHDGINAKYAYIDGATSEATVWAEKLRQLETQSHDQVRIIEYLEGQLKQERNKVIDECIDAVLDKSTEAERFTKFSYQEVKTILQALKDKES